MPESPAQPTQAKTKPTPWQRTQAVASFLWQRLAVGVALVAIALAWWLGTQTGSGPAEKTTSNHAAHAHTETDAQASTPQAPQMYTCSMHPNVRLPDPDAKCPICHMALIPVTASKQAATGPITLSLTKEAAAMAQIQTATIERRFPTAQVRLYGKLRTDETAVSRLTAWFPGRIEKLFVNYVGVPVAKSDHLADLYSPDLLSAFEELRQAKQAAAPSPNASEFVRQNAEQTLQAAREKLRLFGLTQAQIDAAESQTITQDTLTIHAPIAGVVTELNVRQGDYLKVGSPIATVADLSRLWLDLQAYESQLPLLHWGQAVSFTVEAHPGETFTGRVVFIEPMLNEQTRTAAVRVEVDNQQGQLKPGMFASATAQATLSATGVIAQDNLAGKWISPMHPTVIKDGPGACDICGMDLVTTESMGLASADPKDQTAPVVVPKSAVLFTGTRSIVYIQDTDADTPTYHLQTITLGPRAGDVYTVIDGLEPGQQVVTHGAFRIDSAMQIAAHPSMLTAPGSEAAHMQGGMQMSDGDTSVNPTVDPHAGHTMNMTAASLQPFPGDFIQQLSPFYDGYFAIQTALAADDLPKAQAAWQALPNALQTIHTDTLQGKQQTHANTLVEQTTQALHASDADHPFADIAAARKAFEPLSDAAIAWSTTVGHAAPGSPGMDAQGDSKSPASIHRVAFCPMAFENQGADWLQNSETLANPYFGAMMLRCGEFRRSTPAIVVENN